MKQLLLLLIFLALGIHKNIAQYYNEISSDTFYYPFDKGIQMIEIINNAAVSYTQYSTIYIFRNEAGEILNTFNADKKDIAIHELKPTTKEYYTDSFLLYQYVLASYDDGKQINQLFIYRDKELHGLINQYGENMLPAEYLDLYIYEYKEKHIYTLNGKLRGDIINYDCSIFITNKNSIKSKEHFFDLNDSNKDLKSLLRWSYTEPCNF